MSDDRGADSPPPVRGAFPSTRWSLVSSVRARDSHASDALADLCQAYWAPIYSYARRRGYPTDQAEDLTQGFFTKLLEKDYVAQADRQRGKFRTFLLSAFEHFVSNERDRAFAKKRGGGSAILSFDLEEAEGRLQLELAEATSPEQLFARQWAQALLNRVFERMKESDNPDSNHRFDRLKSYLTGSEPSLPYSELAAELGMTEGAVKVAVHRMRKRFAVLVREEVAETVDDLESVTEEIRFLLEALGG